MFRKLIITILIASFALSVSAQGETKVENTTAKAATEDQSFVGKVTSWYMNNMNYGTVTLLMAVESSFIPFPSEVVVPPAAYNSPLIPTTEAEDGVYAFEASSELDVYFSV